ncbi:MAG: hypothetical protein NC313_15000, partial [Butyrivibrio sp.]|nr:hypothetical protein [Butyrivibrio sp.]
QPRNHLLCILPALFIMTGLTAEKFPEICKMLLFTIYGMKAAWTHMLPCEAHSRSVKNRSGTKFKS